MVVDGPHGDLAAGRVRAAFDRAHHQPQTPNERSAGRLGQTPHAEDLERHVLGLEAVALAKEQVQHSQRVVEPQVGQQDVELFSPRPAVQRGDDVVAVDQDRIDPPAAHTVVDHSGGIGRDVKFRPRRRRDHQHLQAGGPGGLQHPHLVEQPAFPVARHESLLVMVHHHRHRHNAAFSQQLERLGRLVGRLALSDELAGHILHADP